MKVIPHLSEKQIRAFGTIVRKRTTEKLIAQHWLNNAEKNEQDDVLSLNKGCPNKQCILRVHYHKTVIL